MSNLKKRGHDVMVSSDCVSLTNRPF